MSTTIAGLQHPDAGTADDNDDTSEPSSVEYSEAGPYRPRGDLVENAVRHGDNALRFLALGLVFAAGLLTFAVVSVALTAHGAPWAMPLGPIAAAGFAWFGFPSFRDHWRKSRAQMRVVIAEAAEWRSPQEELARAVDIFDAALVHRVLSTPVADVDLVRGSYEPTLLHRAVSPLIEYKTEPDDRKKGLDTVRALLEHGASCDARDWKRRTALERVRSACEGKDGKDHVPAELIVLLQNAMDQQNRAANVRTKDIVRRAEARIERERLDRLYYTFSFAAEAHDESTWAHVFAFADRDQALDVVLNECDSAGCTALHHAAAERNVGLVRWLARRGGVVRQRWNGEYDHIDDEGNPVDEDGCERSFETPFDDIEDEMLDELTEAFAAGLREREGDQLRRAIDDMNRALPGRARKRL
jgi:hypothetical protein